MPANQNPEQSARDRIDAMLGECGWVVQDKKAMDFSAGLGVAVREYQTDIGPADYVLFVDKMAVGVIEAKREEAGQNITSVEDQTEGYAAAKLKWITDLQKLSFLYESTGKITRFTDARDPKPRSREVFSFHRPETMRGWIEAGTSLRGRLATVPLLNPRHRTNAQTLAQDFSAWLLANKDQLAALTIFYDQPFRRRDITFAMLDKVMATLRADAPRIAPLRVWQAYRQLENYQGKQPLNELTALVVLIRRACGIDAKLAAFDDTVRRNFQNWILKKAFAGELVPQDPSDEPAADLLARIRAERTIATSSTGTARAPAKRRGTR